MSNIIHNYNYLWLSLAIVCVVLMFWLGARFIKHPQPGFSKKRMLFLWSLRCLACVILLICVLDVREVSQREVKQGANIQLLLDDSSSMYNKNGEQRAKSADNLLQQKIAPLAKDNNAELIVNYSATDLAAQANPGHANSLSSSNMLGNMAKSIESNPKRINALVLFSDGAFTDAQLLDSTIANLNIAKIPVFCWPLGDKQQPDDTRIVMASITQPNAAQPRLRLQAEIAASGFAGGKARLVVSYKGQELLEQKVDLVDGSTQVDLEFNSAFRGLNFYDITLQPQQGEQNTTNNAMRAACELTRDPIKVLYMEGSEPTEVSYLKDAMESDQDFEVDALHFPSHLYNKYPRQRAEVMEKLRGRDERIFSDMHGRPVPSVCHPKQGFPATLKELLHYDVIIVSDIIKEAYTDQQYKDMVNFVEVFGGGFVMIGGDTSFGAGNYHKTPVEKLMPIEVAQRNDMIWSELKVIVSDAGWQHPIMQVGDSKEETMRAWTSEFPGFGGSNNIKRAKPGAITLANSVYQHDVDADFKFLLFSVQDIGAGRTMAFASDTTAAWGDRFETIWGPQNKSNKYYKRFWNNALRWLASGKVSEKGANLRLNMSASQCLLGQNIEINIPSSSAGLPNQLQLGLVDPDGEQSDLRCEWNAAKSAWQASFRADKSGDYIINAVCMNNFGKSVKRQAGVWVHNINNEDIATACNPQLLSKLAAQTGGAMLDESNYKQYLEPIYQQQQRLLLKSELSLWDRWWLLLILLALVCCEWIVRKGASRAAAVQQKAV